MVTLRTKRGGQVFIGAVGLWSHVEQRGAVMNLMFGNLLRPEFTF